MEERYEYDAYGNCHILEPNFADDPDGQSDYRNPYLFTGRRLDILDNGSLKLQYNRNRYYDQYTGRWLIHDPLGYWDGLNLYGYVDNSPVTLSDPYGFWGRHCGKDECEPGDLGYDVLEVRIVPYHTSPDYPDVIKIGDKSLSAIDIATLAKVLLMIKSGMPVAEALAELAKLGVDHLIIDRIKKIINKIGDVLEESGSWMYLRVQLRVCEKDHYGLFWRCYRYKWKNTKKQWYHCPGTSVFHLYEDRADAVRNIDTCKEALDREFGDNKASPEDLRNIWW